MIKNKRISFHIGIGRYDRAAYPTAANLNSPPNDARAMYNLANSLGYTSFDLKPRGEWHEGDGRLPNVLIDEEATYETVVGAFQEAAALLDTPGDKCLITFSGHGTQFRNNDRMPNPDGRFDEALCLFDYAMIDDVWYGLLEGFAKGVDVILVLDNCHSGATSPEVGKIGLGNRSLVPRNDPVVLNRFLACRRAAVSPFGVAKETENPAVSATRLAVKLQRQFNDFNRLALNANVAVFEACGDDQVTFDGKNPGDTSVYTTKFLNAAHRGLTAVGELAQAIAAADPFIENSTPRLQRAGQDVFLRTALAPAAGEVVSASFSAFPARRRAYS